MMLGSPCGSHYTTLIVRDRKCVNNSPVIDDLFTPRKITLTKIAIITLIYIENTLCLHDIGIYNRSKLNMHDHQALRIRGLFLSASDAARLSALCRGNPATPDSLARTWGYHRGESFFRELSWAS